MQSRLSSVAVATLAAFVVLTLCSCSSGPQQAQPGTPAYYWAAAKETFKNGDYAKTSDDLENLLKTDNEFKARAYPWRLVMTSGMTQGYLDFAENQEAGAKAARYNASAFHRQAATARSHAANYAVQFLEAFRKFRPEMKQAEVPLAFDFPAGSLAEPPQMDKVAKGQILPPAELESLQKALVKRGVLQSLCRFLGTADDSAKALDLFKKGDPKAPRDTMLMAIANILYDHVQLFGPTKLGKPDLVKVISAEALATLGAVPQNKQTKDLATKIQANLKKLNLKLT